MLLLHAISDFRPADSDLRLSSLISCSRSFSTCCKMVWYSLSFSNSWWSSLEWNHKGVFIYQNKLHKRNITQRRRWSPVGLELHPAQLHAGGSLFAVGLVWHRGAERADPRGGHSVVVDGRRVHVALVGGMSLWLSVVLHVVLISGVALWGQAEVRPQLWSHTLSPHQHFSFKKDLQCGMMISISDRCKSFDSNDKLIGDWQEMQRALPGTRIVMAVCTALRMILSNANIQWGLMLWLRRTLFTWNQRRLFICLLIKI